jgi:hypothetical protein
MPVSGPEGLGTRAGGILATEPPRRLEVEDAFADADGEPSRALPVRIARSRPWSR